MQLRQVLLSNFTILARIPGRRDASSSSLLSLEFSRFERSRPHFAGGQYGPLP